MSIRLLIGDCRQRLSELPDESVHCVVTSPPYFGLRDYGTGSWEGGDAACEHSVGGQVQDSKAPGAIMSGMRPGADASRCRLCGATRTDQQIGLEPTPDAYVAVMVEVFREVRRVLRSDGTLWLVIGDSYSAIGKTHEKRAKDASGVMRPAETKTCERCGNEFHGGLARRFCSAYCGGSDNSKRAERPGGLKPKDLIGIPWAVAKALQAPYYTGRIKEERDRVWLSAIIDGEGSICGFHHTRKDDGRVRTGIHVTITNSNLDLLDECFRIWPTSRRDHNRHGIGHLGSLDTHRWIAHDVDEKSLLMRELWPHLIAKKKQAMLAWNFLEMSRDAKRLGKVPTGDEMRAKRSWIVHALSALNAQRPVDMPSWIVEPPTLFEPGWYLRSEIIWAKANAMPESVTDRPTKAHEQIFLLSKSARYHYDAEAIAEPVVADEETQRIKNATRNEQRGKGDQDGIYHARGKAAPFSNWSPTRNRRSVWTVATAPFSGAHFAVFPPDLIEPCILAGCPKDCCAACGAPVARIVKRERTRDGEPLEGSFHGEETDGSPQKIGATGVGHWRDKTETTTLGWSPSCACNAGTVPGTVLDCFGGAGTTGLVADRLQRSAILIELNGDYLKLAADRITDDAPLFATVEQ